MAEGRSWEQGCLGTLEKEGGNDGDSGCRLSPFGFPVDFHLHIALELEPAGSGAVVQGNTLVEINQDGWVPSLVFLKHRIFPEWPRRESLTEALSIPPASVHEMGRHMPYGLPPCPHPCIRGGPLAEDTVQSTDREKGWQGARAVDR